MAVKLTPVDTVKIGVIGLGSEGCKLVAALDVNPLLDVSVGLWDSCRDSLDRLVVDTAKIHNLGTHIAHGLGCVGQYELGRSIFLEEQEYCRKWIQDKDLLLVAGALGGGFTGGFFPEFVKMAKHCNTPVIAYALMPFSFEGRKRMEGSRQVLGKLRETCMSVAIFEGDDYLSEMDEAGFAKPALNVMCRECSNAMSDMASMLLEEGLYEFSLSTLRSAFDLDVSKTLVISAESSHEDELQEVDSIIETLLERIDQKLPERDLRVDRLLINVVGGKRLAAGAVNQINRMVTERFDQPGKTFFGACIRDDLKGMRIVVYVSIHLGKQFEWIDLSDTAMHGTASIHHQSRKVASKKLKERKKRKKGEDDAEEPQGFFDTILNESNRGYFDDTPANSWNGIDLDVPTYIRRGIRVKS